MTVDEMKAAYAKLQSKIIPDRRDGFFRVQENQPVTFAVLAGGCESFPHVKSEGYSSEGVWVRHIGSHYLQGKRIQCPNISEPNSCYICEQIYSQEEALELLKEECAKLQKANPAEAKALSLQIEKTGDELQRIRCQDRFVMNILEKGKDLPTVYEAPKTVASTIMNMFEISLREDNMDIFDPLQATFFTVERTGTGLNTKYSVTPSPRGAPIITGEDRDERIKNALIAGVNFDTRYKLPAHADQVKAWEGYLHPTEGQNGARQTRPSSPAPLSHIAPPTSAPARATTPVATKTEEPDDIQYGDEVQQPVAQTDAKPETTAKVESLLSRLKAAGTTKK